MKALLLILTLFILPTVSFSQEVPPQTPPPVPPPRIVYEEADPKEDPYDNVIEFPDKEAQFKGGTEAFKEYIGLSVNYPPQAIERNIQGKVYLSFIVEKNGKITDVKVVKGAHPALDEEAKRVISEMPKWKPGKVGRKKVRTRCMVPINFVLE